MKAYHAAILSLVTLTGINFIDSYSRYLISVALLPYVDYGGFEYGLLSGALFSVIYAAGGVIIALWGRIDHITSLLTVATLIFSIAFFCTGFTNTFWQLAVIRIVMGIGQSVFTPYSTRILGISFEEKYRGVVFGIFNFALYLSFALVLSLGTYMYDEYGWQSGYFLFGIIGMALGALIPFTVTEDPTCYLRLSNSRLNWPHESADDRDARSSFLSGYRQISASDESAFLSSIVSDSLVNDEYIINNVCNARDNYNLVGSKHLEKDIRDTDTAMSQSYNFPDTPRQLLDELLHFWKQNQSLTFLCLAMGVRMGGGFIWSAYTAVFFSELYVDNGDSCTYSYNSTALDTSGSCTDSSYRYCVDEVCSDIAPTPWHNEGNQMKVLYFSPLFI